MKLILKSGAVALVDDARADDVAGREWDQLATGHVVSASSNGHGHHVLVLDRLIADPPDGHIVEHINGRLLDNRAENLRVVKYVPYRSRRNGPNAHNNTGLLGVHWDKSPRTRKPFRAQIAQGYRRYNLGHFETKEEALAYRQAAELCVFGAIRT